MECDIFSGSNPCELLVNDIPLFTKLVISAAHALALIEDEDKKYMIVGDPMEKAGLESIQWDLIKDNVIQDREKFVRLDIKRRFGFNSSLKRMATISKIDSKLKQLEMFKNGYLVALKGAPEVVVLFFKTVPDFYYDTVNKLTSEGNRVLALAYKSMAIDNVKSNLF